MDDRDVKIYLEKIANANMDLDEFLINEIRNVKTVIELICKTNREYLFEKVTGKFLLDKSKYKIVKGEDDEKTYNNINDSCY